MEPLSILSVVGTSVGLFGFVVTTITGTIENVHTRKELYKNCLRKLRDYESELKHQMGLLESWEKLWFLGVNQPYDRATYRYLWGSDGYTEVKQKLRDIWDEFVAIIEILRFRHVSCRDGDWRDLPFRRSPSDPDVEAWNGLLTLHLQRSSSLRVDPLDSNPQAGIFWRFSFAIYKNRDISDKITQLKSSMEQLKNRSEDLFWKRFDQLDIRRPIDVDYLRKLLKLNRNLKRFADFFRRIHDAHETDYYNWELVISEARQSSRRIPDLECRFHVSTLQDTIACLEEGQDISCTFYADTFDESGNIVAHTFDVRHPRDSAGLAETTSSSLQSVMSTWNTPFMPHLYLTHQPLQWRKIRESLRQVINNESFITDCDDWVKIRECYKLIKAASSISRTVIFFYGTGWAEPICACDIIHVDLRYSSSHRRKLVTLWPRPSNREGSCRHVPNRDVPYETFLFLGVLLIEIAIVARIDFRLAAPSEPNPGSLIFEVPARILPPSLPSTFNQEQLLENFQQLIPKGAGGHVGRKYYHAVEECFKMREKFLARGDSELLITDIERCVETIVQPLEDHCECLRRYYAELGQAIGHNSYFADD